MARIIFATVGTTSFEGFVQSLCSVSFLTAMAHHHSLRCHQQQQQQQQQEQHHNATDHCVELVIQYGRGQCPREYLSKAQHHYEASTQPTTHQSSNNTEKINEDDGSIILSIPIDTSLSLSPKEEEKIKIFIRWYRFQPSLSEDMQRSSMILCHAGAGTLLEALNLSSEITINNDENTTSKPKQKMIINAVINSTLMNNHQSELAQELERRQHIKVTWNPILEWGTEEGASKFWKDIGMFQPVLFSGGGNRRVVDDEGNSVSCKSEQGRGNAFVNKFQTIVDRVMGFSTDDIDDVIQSTQY